MRIVPLPAQEEELPDEQDDTFLEALYAARQEDELDLSRFCAAPSARLGQLSFESDRAFPSQC